MQSCRKKSRAIVRRRGLKTVWNIKLEKQQQTLEKT